MSEFNLIEEAWIPCIDLEGRLVEYGVRDTLLKAHYLREICDGSPLVTVSIHRLLLAILYRAYQGPQDSSTWKTMHAAGAFDTEKINSYLDKWSNRFNLFNKQYPFMQVAGLDLNEYSSDGKVKKDKSDGLMRLSREAPDKGGRILFDHRVGTKRNDYGAREIAKMILSAQSYSGTGVASAGKVGLLGIKPSACQFAPCVEGLVLWLQGENVFDTLLLKLVPRDFEENDKPAWEDDSIIHAAIGSWISPRSFAGPLQRFVPLSRFIRLIDRRSMFFTNGLKTSTDSDDPMKAYARSDQQSNFEPIKLRKDKAAWRDAHTLFTLNSSTRKPPVSLNQLARLHQDGSLSKTSQPRANLVGLATDQGKALLWRHERLPVPVELLAQANLIEQLGQLLQNAEQAAFELNARMRRIAKLYLAPDSETPGAGQPDSDEVTKVADSIDARPAYWSRMENHFLVLLENLPNDWAAATDSWKPDEQMAASNVWREQVRREARQSLQESIRCIGTTARAIQAIARVRTDFNDDDLKPPLSARLAKGKTRRKS